MKSVRACFRFAALGLAFAEIAIGTAASAVTPPPTRLHWIVSQSSCHRLEAVMPAGALQAKLDNPNTFEIINDPRGPDPLPHAKHIKFYRDETLMEADLASGKLAHFDGVLMDDEAYKEAGNSTPQAQIEDPLPFVQRAARALHAAGKLLVLTIGFKVGPKGQFWKQTLPSVVPYADVVDFQTQGAEGTPRFAKMVAHLSRIFRANGGHLMTVGLAISPRGEAKTYDDLLESYRAALAVRPPVDGFWMNIAVKSASCTGCTSRPDVEPAAQLLLTTNE